MSRVPSSPKFFFKHTWSKFSPKRNLAFLLHGEEQFTGQKETITKAISTWIIKGKSSGKKTDKNKIKINHINLTRNAIRLQLIEIIASYENNIINATSDKEVLSQDIIGRSKLIDGDYFSLAYYPIGGLKSLMRVKSIQQHRRNLDKSLSEIKTLIEMMRIYHYWEIHFKNDPKYSRPSKRKSKEILAAIEKNIKDYKKKGNAEKLNQSIMGRSSLIYAAHSIHIDEDRTLLDFMLNHSLSYEVLSKNSTIEIWLRRAQYVNENIHQYASEITNQANRGDYKPYDLNLRYLPDSLEPEPFELSPPYPADIERILSTGYILNKGGRGKKAKKFT